MSGINNVSDLVAQIATATEQQSSTTDEITANMESITEISSSNVSAVREVNNATTDLAALATGLKNLVSGFKVSNTAREAVVYSQEFTGMAVDEPQALEGPKSKVVAMKSGD